MQDANLRVIDWRKPHHIKWLLLLVAGLIGGLNGNGSDAIRETEGPQGFASVSRGEWCGLEFPLWSGGSLAVVDKQAVVTGSEDLQTVCSQGVADARLVPLAPPILPASGRGQVAAAEEPTEVEGLGALRDTGLSGVSVARSGDKGAVGVRLSFFEGYRDADGQDEERIDAMIFCESSWRIDPGGYHLGLAQFSPGTWATVSAITGFTDPFNPYHQGYNVAVWASMVSPGTTAGWAQCWRA